MNILNKNWVKIIFLLAILVSIVYGIYLNITLNKYKDKFEFLQKELSEAKSKVKKLEEEKTNNSEDIEIEDKALENEEIVNNNTTVNSNPPVVNTPPVENPIDVKKETWNKLKGGWKTETMDKPGIEYPTKAEKELYQDDYASVYYYLYFADDDKLLASYVAINFLGNQHTYYTAKMLDESHIDINGREYYISKLSDSELIIDGRKFIRNNGFGYSDFFDENGKYCVYSYVCPIYSK